MPNGRGTLDCEYCRHYVGSGRHALAHCAFHDAELPPSNANRICCHFDPSQLFLDDNGAGAEFWPVARRFAWFGQDLEPGVLYEFDYPNPPSIRRLIVLRDPDYSNWSWQKR